MLSGFRIFIPSLQTGAAVETYHKIPALARGPVVFHQGQPAQSVPVAAAATVGGSEALPVSLRPDELFECPALGAQLARNYGLGAAWRKEIFPRKEN